MYAVMSNKLLSISHAAKLINVSSQFMIRLLDEGAIRSVGVGTQRRIEETALLAFRERRKAERHAAIKSLATADTEAGVYDLVILPEGAEDE